MTAVMEDPATDYTDPEDISPDEVDPDAPYGRNPATGRPYTKSPEERAAIGQRLAEARARAAAGGGSRNARPKIPAPAKRGSGTQGKGRAPAGPDYTTALLGLLQIPSFGLAMASKVRPVLALDAAALQLHGPGLCHAVAETARTDPRLAGLLDRILQVGPYGAILAAGMPLVLQVLANHGALQPSPEMGILDPEGLQAALGATP